MSTSGQDRLHSQTSWFNCQKRNPAASMRLFCFPYAGGGASTFYTWANALSPNIEVCAVQLPGREHRLSAPLFTQLPPLIQAIGEAIVPYLDKPFAFYGHSMGGLLGFELARLLRREARAQPVHLLVSGCRGPQVADPERLTYNLPEPEFLEELRTLNGTPQEVLEHPELMQVIMPILRADFEIVQTYAYTVEPPFDCPISAFGGLEDSKVSGIL